MRDLTTKQFDQFVSTGVVVIEFWEKWCKPCTVMKEVFDEVSKKAKVKFGRIEVAANSELASKETILSVPSFIIYKDGREKERLTGIVPKEVLLEEIKNVNS